MAGKYRFRLRAVNNKIVAVSEAYENKAGCMNGVKSVQTNCNSHIEDQTAEMEKMTNPKYEVFTDVAGKFRFNLKASNGEIIAASEAYETKQGVLNGIEAVQKSCDAEIEDLTVTQEVKDKQLAEEVEKSCYAGATTEAITYNPYENVEVCKEPAPGVNATTIELSAPPSVVDSGSLVTFKGRLTMSDSGEGIGCVVVHMFERDRSFLRDDLLAFGQTEPDGTFAIDWTAKQKDFWDDKVQVYARFVGTDNYTHSRSDVYHMKVLWYAKRK
ncbi:YegP family protein [Candidatus Bathyarchaeota archaeon]|nr:YegP family protein [Candidatus Bathyarchaeota archaeon]